MEHYSTGKHIEAISFSNGTVKFVKSGNRLDMPGDYMLGSIEVYSSQSSTQPIKKYNLNCSYFDSDAGLNTYSSGLLFNTDFKKRLRLDRIEELSTLDKMVHSFEYVPDQLPSVFSNSQDHWGFYNGADNPSLVPLDAQNGYGSSAVNRGVSFQNTKIGTLSKIYYPTGGYSEFTYESNEASITEAEYNQHFYPYGPVSIDSYETFGAAVYKSPDGNILSDTVFVNPDAQPFNLVGDNVVYNVQRDEASNCNCGDRTCVGTLSVTVTCIDCGTISSSFTITSCQYSNGACSGYLKLIPGKTYVLQINRGYEFNSIDAGIGGRFFKPPTPSTSVKRNIPVGGLRIKKVDIYPSTTQLPLSTEYYYNTSVGYVPGMQAAYESSGVLTSFPVYDSYSTFVQQVRQNGSATLIQCLFKFRTCNSRIPLGGMEGTVVGYSDVQTYKTDGNDKIKTISSFYSPANNPDILDYSFPFTITRSN
ncbi:MAG: hypothetical protein ACKO1F_09995, partial [Flammeovirgaceae bacterium]